MSTLSQNIVDILIRIANYGVTAELDPKLVRNIRVTNLASLAHVFFTFPYFFVFYYTGAMFLAFYVIPLTLIFAAISLINKHGYYNLSRSVLLGAINVSVFIYASSLGEATQIQNVFFFTLIAPLMLFHIKETRWIFFCVLQPALLWPTLNLTNYYHVIPVTHLEENYINFIAQAISVTNSLLLFCCTYYMFWAYQKSEDKLVTAKELAEQAQAKAEKLSTVKSEFLAMMSHELRTPLNGIIGTTQLLADNQDPQAQQSYTDLILSSSQLLLTILNDILDFEKMAVGKMQLASESFNVCQMIHETSNMLQPDIEQKGLQFSVHLDETCPAQLVGDSTRFQQVLLNLLSNANKFTQRGFIKLRLETVQKLAGQIRLCISVQDSGIGIAPQDIQKIFQPFSQAESFLRRKAGGTGLGLAMSQHIAKLMHGEIKVESEIKQGSTFRFYACLAESSEDEAPKSQKLPPKPIVMPPQYTATHAVGVEDNPVTHKPESSEVKITKPQKQPSKPRFEFPQYTATHALVVEDNPVNQKVVQMMLQKFGLTVDIAEDGQVGVDMFQAQDYDIVLMDCSMPILDGYQATELIRQFEAEKKCSPTPIVALTANTYPEDQQRCLAVGMDEFIAKPAKVETVAAMLNKFCSAE